LAGLVLSMSGFSNAGLITISHANLLPTSGYESIDLDFDGINDIYMAVRYSGGDKAYFSLSSGTDMASGFVSLGTMIDNSLTWLTSGYQDPVMSIGNNYLGIFNTSSGAFYGYATIDYDGTDMYLASYTYDDTGSGIRVTSTDVPEPSTLAIFALGIMGLASRRFKK